MTGRIEVPGILNELARAGKAGLPLPLGPGALRDIELCRAWGYDIRAAGSRAVLERNEDALVPAWIEQESIARAWRRLTVAGFFSLGSTNDEAASCARAGVPGGLLVCAEEQTSGKGRKGRRWNSPARAGLYFSLLVRPSQPLIRWPVLTHATAVALVETVRQAPSLTGRLPDIDLKWPNDVLLSGRKVAGILLETVWGAPEDPGAVVGVGINLSRSSVPEDLFETATSIEDEAGVAVPRRALLVSFLDHFQAVYALFEEGHHGVLLDRWKACSSMWEGTPVQVVDGARTRLGVTCGLTEIGALRVRLAGGAEETVLAGDVTVRRGAGN